MMKQRKPTRSNYKATRWEGVGTKGQAVLMLTVFPDTDFCPCNSNRNLIRLQAERFVTRISGLRTIATFDPIKKIRSDEDFFPPQYIQGLKIEM